MFFINYLRNILKEKSLAYFKDIIVNLGDTKRVIQLNSINKEINKIELLEGRLPMKNDEIQVLALATYELLEIFLNAEIIDWLSLVNSTDPKSAIYSLLREIANLIKG